MVHVLLFTYGNLYCYGANNPVKYTDPDGAFTISVGYQFSAGAGTAGSIEEGAIVGFSKEGFSSGIYKSTSIGTEFGISSFSGITFSFDPFSNLVRTSKDYSFIVGGSYEKFLGFGIDASYNLELGEFSTNFTKGFQMGSLKLGFADSPTIGEIHLLYNTTETIETHDIYSRYLEPVLIETSIKIKQIEYNIVDYIFKSILGGNDFGN